MDTHILEEWYCRDENSVPPAYYLKPKAQMLKNYQNSVSLASFEKKLCFCNKLKDNFRFTLFLSAGEKKQNRNRYSTHQLPVPFVWTVLPLPPVLLRWSQAAQPRQRMTRPGGKSQRRSRGSSEQRCCCCRRREPWRVSRPRNSSALVSLRSTSLCLCIFSCECFREVLNMLYFLMRNSLLSLWVLNFAKKLFFLTC